MNDDKPLILISNDDGYHAKGINTLVDMVSPLAHVIVCAPESARSGFGCAFSAATPLKLFHRRHRERKGVEVWSCDGTPVDCVKLALQEIVPRRPDLIIGGINHGDNASVNTHYSGTMGVVMEGCMKYIPSVAFSICDHDADADFEPLRPYVVNITQRLLEEGLPRGICLNVNFPVLDSLTAYNGVKVCRMAFGSWVNEIDRRHHLRGYDYYWMVGNYQTDEPEADDTDSWALRHGYVAITPTRMDVTAYEVMDQMKVFETMKQ